MKKLDLLIIDIDDTFIYHRTVAIGNKIFLETLSGFFGKRLNDNRLYTTWNSIFIVFRVVILNFFRFRFSKGNSKKFFKLIKISFYLHFLNFIRKINNRLFNIICCEKIIKVWASAVVSLHIKTEEYQLSKKVIEKNINKKVLSVYNSLKRLNPKMKVVAITQNFVVNSDSVKEILGINLVKSNRFIVDNGIISDFELNVKNGRDKKKVADEVIKKFKPKSVGLFIEDYDDVSLLKLENLKFVLYKKKIKRFIDKKDITLLRF
ncbi:hypothetical protein CEE44_04745 [Candidatus Woesearchaeota archaeon B3_Woes]|nr:MAG: hypothetical protein CEE44_04745 [Candidatus Woesearchaeota archaeon B3_Woes]